MRAMWMVISILMKIEWNIFRRICVFKAKMKRPKCSTNRINQLFISLGIHWNLKTMRFIIMKADRISIREKTKGNLLVRNDRGVNKLFWCVHAVRVRGLAGGRYVHGTLAHWHMTQWMMWFCSNEWKWKIVNNFCLWWNRYGFQCENGSDGW